MRNPPSNYSWPGEIKKYKLSYIGQSHINNHRHSDQAPQLLIYSHRTFLLIDILLRPCQICHLLLA